MSAHRLGKIWRLHLEGLARLIDPAGGVHVLERRAAALFALVVIEGEVTRARAAVLLWPDASESQGRHALRQQLLRLRKLGGGELIEGDQVLRLATAVAWEPASRDEHAVLLASHGYDDSEALAQWVDQQRQRLRRERVQWWRAQGEQAEREQDHERAVRAARWLVEEEPENEEHHRQLMRAHYVRGDVAAAQHAYEQLRQMLQQEFQAAPSEATEQLVRAQQDARHVPSALYKPSPASLPMAVMRPPRLIGREAEWRALEEHWSNGAIILVVGEAGKGKTRLLQDFAACQVGVVQVGARAGDAHVPYALLTRLVRSLPAEATMLPESVRIDLARLIPELGPAPPLQSDARRDDFIAAVHMFIRFAVERGLRGLIIDDLHYADEATIETLPLLLGGDVQVPTVLAFRETELSTVGAVWIDDLESTSAGYRISLEPFPLQHIEALLDSLDLELIDSIRLAPLLMRRTGGNPLFVLETVKMMLLQRGVPDASTWPAVSATLEGLISRRLDHLSSDAAQLAHCAALAGQDFSIELTAAVLNVRAIDLVEAWKELESARIFRDGFFAHDLFAQAASVLIPAEAARKLHGAIASFLEAHDGEPGRILIHWCSAADWARAAPVAIRAAMQARNAGRYLAEASLLEDAARYAQRAGNQSIRFEALRGRVEALVLCDLGTQTIQAIENLEAAVCNDEQRLLAWAVKARVLTNRGESEAAVDIAGRGLALAQRLGRVDLILQFAPQLAGALCDLRRATEALSHLEPLRQVAAESANPRDQIEFLDLLGLAYDRSCRLHDALHAYDTAVRLAKEHRISDLLWQAMSNMGSTYAKLGQGGRAIDLGRQALQLAVATESLRGRPVHSQVMLAHRLRDGGQYREAVLLLEEAVDVFRTSDQPYWLTAALHRLALAYAQLGQHARAQHMLRDDPAGAPLLHRAMWIAHRAEVMRLSGAPAAGVIREALTLLGEDQADGAYWIAMLFASGMTPADEGEALATRVLAWATTQLRLGMVLAAHTRIASCALAQDATARALPHIEAAQRLSNEYDPDCFYRAEIWWVAAQTLRAAGRDTDADRAIADGVAWIKDIATSHVPDCYRDSFLNRNSVNRAMLAAASRLSMTASH